MADDNELVFLPLGGVGEIGMNMALYGYGPPDERIWMMVDCGITFAHESLPGVDVVFPDTRFIEEERANLAGIVLTHAHEDHYGAVLELWPRLEKQVFATRFTAGLLAAKAEGMQGAPKVPVTVVGQGDRVTVGPFEVEYVALSHSIPEPNALAIRTPLGTVLHSGDWKIDAEPGVGKAIDLPRLAEIGREGVRALICDSTNALREGRSRSEAEVAKALKDVVAAAPARVAVTLFSSNVARIRAVGEAARAAGRSVVVVGRSLWRMIDVAKECGYLGDLTFLEEEAYKDLPRQNVVLLCTGSQGENRAALARIAGGDHRNIDLTKGDTVIFSSRTIPGNERAVNTVINQLCDKGVTIVTDREAPIHTSGHPCRDELRELYGLLKPEVAVPVHGEALHLTRHAELARSLGVGEVMLAENGKMVRLAPGPAEIVDEAPAGVLYRDGNLIVDPDESGVRERRKLSFAGAVFVSLLLDTKGNIIADPEVAVIGLPDTDDVGEPFDAIVVDAVENAIHSIPRSRRRDPDLVGEAARRAARAAVLERWGKKTHVVVMASVV
ncbi:ribonuclease J [Rhodobium gokarnense]|uniref:Ribonuclease J n=1 Tax=Rhodobium gokarnense TaxID=364296 RepID=A0ABT3HFX8_9HYPH|nr:ribonuclease J [Rhodobium gokarnense]MCW2309307.1 ribonuclease J [Rhodobium gokarnense]